MLSLYFRERERDLVYWCCCCYTCPFSTHTPIQKSFFFSSLLSPFLSFPFRRFFLFGLYRLCRKIDQSRMFPMAVLSFNEVRRQGSLLPILQMPTSFFYPLCIFRAMPFAPSTPELMSEVRCPERVKRNKFNLQQEVIKKA